MSKLPLVQQTAPERIWLAVADDAYYAEQPFPDGAEEVCWSSDAPLEVCVPYVRADLANPAPPTSGECVAAKVGPYRVTVAENAVTISEGRKIVFTYDADAPPTSGGGVPEFVMCRCQDETARRLCADRGRCLRAVAQSATQPTPAGESGAEEYDVIADADRAVELAERLVLSGPKAAHVSASETHELSEWVIAAAARLTSGAVGDAARLARGGSHD